MAAKTFLRLVTGRKTEVAGIVTSAGAGNDGDIPALDSTGRLDVSVMPVGITPESKSVIASEALSAGNMINVYSNAGTLNARKADATAAGKEANGFVLAGVSSLAAATVFFEGTNTQLSGLTVGSRYFLDTTAGAVTTTPPAASGNVAQYIGVALSATEISFEPDDGVIRA